MVAAAMKCSVKDCPHPATHWAFGKKVKVPRKYCLDHAQEVVEEGEPESVVICPRCGCGFGVFQKGAGDDKVAV